MVLVDLKGSQGREQEKTRPCVIVSNDELNKKLSTVVVVPISSLPAGMKCYAYEVALKQGDGELDNDAAAMPQQIRTIDKFERIVEIWGSLSDESMDELTAAIEWVTTPEPN